MWAVTSGIMHYCGKWSNTFSFNPCILGGKIILPIFKEDKTETKKTQVKDMKTLNGGTETWTWILLAYSSLLENMKVMEGQEDW
jgi:hypothetical protein